MSKRLILVEVYIDDNAQDTNDLRMTEDEIFEEVIEDFGFIANGITHSKYFGYNSVQKVWLVPDTGDCS